MLLVKEEGQCNEARRNQAPHFTHRQTAVAGRIQGPCGQGPDSGKVAIKINGVKSSSNAFGLARSHRAT